MVNALTHCGFHHPPVTLKWKNNNHSPISILIHASNNAIIINIIICTKSATAIKYPSSSRTTPVPLTERATPSTTSTPTQGPSSSPLPSSIFNILITACHQQHQQHQQSAPSTSSCVRSPATKGAVKTAT